MNILKEDLSSPEARGKRIRFIREHLLSLSREQFCIRADFTAASLKGWELAWGGGLSAKGAEKIVLIAKQLGIYCTDTWLMHGIGLPAALFTHDLETNVGDVEHIAKELLLFREMPDSIDMIIKDDALVPFLYPGNYVGGIIVNNIEDAVGKECIIGLEDSEKLTRILKHGEGPGRFSLYCLNERATLVKTEIKNINIKFAAPIVWIRRVHRQDHPPLLNF